MSKQLNFAQQMDEVLKTLAPARPKLLLHACCGPCSSAVLEKLCRYFEITVLYYNPNTWPAEEYHRRGVGKMLFAAAKQRAKELGYSFLQVKTVQMGKYPEYDATNRFYLALGFGEFEVFPTLWDEWNPCQIYVMSLK